MWICQMWCWTKDNVFMLSVCCFPALTLVPLPCPVLAESFREFADQHPDFAEQYLYSDNAGFGSSSPSHAANGFCADFSPSEQKKLDWASLQCLLPAVRDIWLVPLRLLVFSSSQHLYFKSKLKGICFFLSLSFFFGKRHTWKPSTYFVSHEVIYLCDWYWPTVHVFEIRDENIQSVMNPDVFFALIRSLAVHAVFRLFMTVDAFMNS